MASSNQFLQYVLEQLTGLDRLVSRRMFGGAGLYSGDLFFGLIYEDRLYFRTDDGTRPEYEARGGEAFRPRPKFAALKSSYYTVPAEVLEDSEELISWARKAAAAALASQAEKASRKASARKTSTRKTSTGRPGRRRPKAKSRAARRR